MKSGLYIKHDVYTLDDIKVGELVYRYHEAGYGVWWAVVERLSIEESHRMSLDILVRQVAMKLDATKPARVREIVKALVELDLLVEEDGEVWNKRVMEQCQRFEDYHRSQTENALKRWRTDEAPKPQQSESRRARAKALVEQYHSTCPSLSKVRTITEARVVHANTFLEAFKPEEVAEGLSKAEASDFLKNGNGTWNGANFDWLVNKSNFAKVLEGNYDNKERSRKGICNDADTYLPNRKEDGGFDL